MYSTAGRARVDENAEGRRVVAVDDVVLRFCCCLYEEEREQAHRGARCAAGLQARFAAATSQLAFDAAAAAGVQLRLLGPAILGLYVAFAAYTRRFKNGV